MCRKTPLLSFNMQLNGQGSSFNNIQHSKPSSSLISLWIQTLAVAWSPALVFISCEKKSLLVEGHSALHATQAKDGTKELQSHLETLLMCLLIKNLSLSSDRYNYSFIWKNIYHAVTEQIASSNKHLLNEQRENIRVVFSTTPTPKDILGLSGLLF